MNDNNHSDKQRIWVFQQNNSGESKIQGIRRYAQSDFEIETFDIDGALPDIIEDSSEYFPEIIDADLVLDYLKHPDLSYDLGKICVDRNIPVVASGKNHDVEDVYTPQTCCALPKNIGLGRYGERFGMPELKVEVSNGIVSRIDVVRGAPCGSTWEAAKRMIGLSVEEAPVRYSLDMQYFCTANPAAWDPIYGKSPLHFSADIHKAALIKALKQTEKGK